MPFTSKTEKITDYISYRKHNTISYSKTILENNIMYIIVGISYFRHSLSKFPVFIKGTPTPIHIIITGILDNRIRPSIRKKNRYLKEGLTGRG